MTIHWKEVLLSYNVLQPNDHLIFFAKIFTVGLSASKDKARLLPLLFSKFSELFPGHSTATFFSRSSTSSLFVVLMATGSFFSFTLQLNERYIIYILASRTEYTRTASIIYAENEIEDSEAESELLRILNSRDYDSEMLNQYLIYISISY